MVPRNGRRAGIRAALAAASYDDTVPARAGDMSVRAVAVHMIEAYAQHNGHADLLRESVDGTTDK